MVECRKLVVMKSGDPKPNDDLKVVMDAKRGGPSSTVDVVSEASGWLKSALKGAGVYYNYASCEEDRYGFSAFTIIRFYQKIPTTLDIKIAEINERPYVFAEVRSLGKFEGTLFPLFVNLKDESDREILLHFIADFVLSTSDCQ